jgi:hypothetical protein
MDGSFLVKVPSTSLASAIFFGSFVFASVALSTRAALKAKRGDGKDDGSQSNSTPKQSALDVSNWHSWCALCQSLSSLGLILFYAYLCEHHPPYPHADKSYDRDYVFFLSTLILLLAGTSWRSIYDAKQIVNMQNSRGQPVVTVQGDTTENAFLNRFQTEEWKGWMQTIFLLYHYFHGVELYNPIRVMITCYVWLTGFGNFSFFYSTGDYSGVRLLQMLFRLNFLVTCLCLTQGTNYILYYICPLHTFWFGIVYITMRIFPDTNYTLSGIRVKLIVLALCILLVWDLSGLFGVFFGLFLSTRPTLGATSGVLWEWYFRTTLDHWSTLWGMVFALQLPVMTLFWNYMESLPLHKHFGMKVFIGGVLSALFAWWVTGPLHEERHIYNQGHAYMGIIPLMTYVFWRNSTKWLRCHYLELLRQLGKTTLETYLMQHHIWMTSSAKTILTIIPGYPKMNFLLVTILYVSLSRKLFGLTMTIRTMLLPDNLRSCVATLAALVSSFLLCYFAVIILGNTGMLSMWTLGACSVVGGSILYSTIMHLAGRSFAEINASPAFRSTRVLLRYIPVHLLGAGLVLYALGSGWGWLASHGAGEVRALGDLCADHVQNGAWSLVNVCGEEVQGELYRAYGIAGLGTCIPQSPTYVWGWKISSSSSQCRIRQRSSTSVLDHLENRSIVFIGDSILRHLYHSMCRQVGDEKAGMYNTTAEKHGNFTRQYATLRLDFLWAPYTTPAIDGNLGSTLRSLFEETGRLPDAIVVGGGAWDQLHHNHNTTENKFLIEGIRHVVTEMTRLREAGVAITWIVPTTINTWGLLTEQKREHLREDQMVSLRDLYKIHGIHDAANFVLDGTSFTRDRVLDSYDGVHYPLEVYDAGSQILINSFDWLLPHDDDHDLRHIPPSPGSMANPLYGITITVFLLLSLYCMDAFAGISVIASIVAFVPEVSPINLYNEAFTALHNQKRHNLWNLVPGSRETVSNFGSNVPHTSQDTEMMHLTGSSVK